MYVDVLLLENLIINYFILNITSKFSRIGTTRIKLFTGSVVGAVYVLVVFFPQLKIFYTLPIKIALSIFMVTIVFTPDKFRDFFKALGIFYMISFAFGGAAFAVFFFTGRGNIINGVYYIRDFPLSLLITGFAIGYLLLTYCMNYIQNKILCEELIYNIVIEFDDKKTEVNGILDTGNSLKDPLTNFPVIVVEYSALRSILPDRLSVVFKDENNDEIDFTRLYDCVDNTNLTLRIRLIPFSSLGKHNGMLLGIKPDNVRLIHNDECREVKDVVIGLYNKNISKDGNYRALLYPEIIK